MLGALRPALHRALGRARLRLHLHDLPLRPGRRGTARARTGADRGGEAQPGGADRSGGAGRARPDRAGDARRPRPLALGAGGRARRRPPARPQATSRRRSSRARSSAPTSTRPAGLDEARAAIEALRGDDLPGPERLADDGRELRRRAGRRVRARGQPASRGRSPSERGLAIYRTAQEALTNVRKHADPEPGRAAPRLRRRAAPGSRSPTTRAERRGDGSAPAGPLGRRRRRLRGERDARAGRAARRPARGGADRRRLPGRALAAADRQSSVAA